MYYWKRSNPNCNGNRRDEVVQRTTCIKNVKFKIVKIRTGCQYAGYFYYVQRKPKLGRIRPVLGRGLDITGLDKKGSNQRLFKYQNRITHVRRLLCSGVGTVQVLITTGTSLTARQRFYWLMIEPMTCHPLNNVFFPVPFQNHILSFSSLGPLT